MTYRYQPAETSQESFRRVSVEELDRAIQELTDGVKVDPVNAVHEARKAIKMERALLRFSRGAVKGKARRRLNASLRDTARRLSGARDADVMVEAVEALAERYAGQVPAPTFAAIKTRLGADRADANAAEQIPPPSRSCARRGAR